MDGAGVLKVFCIQMMLGGVDCFEGCLRLPDTLDRPPPLHGAMHISCANERTLDSCSHIFMRRFRATTNHLFKIIANTRRRPSK